ncbi:MULTISPECIES: glucosamine-6-phosphate deaminase [unclassified Salipiger]|uniref:glucosamine-6-phosphate deaminase n=1 Tax=unclassified Salipiger TaxID=2640570 RepID=UPI0013BD355B|nr:glucosamine-6-phosphate deaminase [Salipiger sp. PrR003]NDW35711.1 glucosamine-6-phosphate deaminase [Salipiger sp. PrR007]
MKILILGDAAAAAVRAAEIIAAQLTAKPASVLGLATGGTMEAVYEKLIALHRAGRASFAGAQSFNLDEYVGLSGDHPCSYRRYMAEKLFDQIDIEPDAAHLPMGEAADAEAEAARYEAAIVAAGDIDLQLLGLGLNGHIGFNEPTSSLSSITRLKTLERSTREANSRYFPEGEEPPRLAITMGIGTIMRAREVLLVATGAAKARAVAQVVEGPVSARWPGSVLQMHRHATLVLDRAAASELELFDYYLDVHPE